MVIHMPISHLNHLWKNSNWKLFITQSLNGWLGSPGQPELIVALMPLTHISSDNSQLIWQRHKSWNGWLNHKLCFSKWWLDFQGIILDFVKLASVSSWCCILDAFSMRIFLEWKDYIANILNDFYVRQ